MRIRSKAALAVLAMAIASFPNFAQTPRQGPPPDQSQGPDGFGQRGAMRQMRPDERRGQWGRMGMGGWGMGRHGFGRAGFLNNEAIRQRLGITSAQLAKIHQQDSAFQKSQIRARADLQVKRIELNELLAADNPNRAAIDAKLQEVSAAQMASEKSAIDNQLALRDILTPAQRQQLQQLRMNGFQPNGPAQTPAGAGRGGRGPGQPGTPPPPNQQGQAPAKQ